MGAAWGLHRSCSGRSKVPRAPVLQPDGERCAGKMQTMRRRMDCISQPELLCSADVAGPLQAVMPFHVTQEEIAVLLQPSLTSMLTLGGGRAAQHPAHRVGGGTLAGQAGPAGSHHHRVGPERAPPAHAKAGSNGASSLEAVQGRQSFQQLHSACRRCHPRCGHAEATACPPLGAARLAAGNAAGVHIVAWHAPRWALSALPLPSLQLHAGKQHIRQCQAQQAAGEEVVRQVLSAGIAAGHSGFWWHTC